jgi:hypothetical protein
MKQQLLRQQLLNAALKKANRAKHITYRKDFSTGMFIMILPAISQVNEVKKPHGHINRIFEQVSCPHCGKVGAAHIMQRWHFSNCDSLI